MSNRIPRLAIAALMVSAAQVSFAACQDGDVAGLTGKDLPGATGACASDTIAISGANYAITDNPPCPDSDQLSGPQISASIQSTLSTAADAVGSYYGGPLL